MLLVLKQHFKFATGSNAYIIDTYIVIQTEVKMFSMRIYAEE